ncbi:MAG: TRAP transporter substrate-binding protein [Clostridia bacterium]|nr:TRAP transporter substrate-binding protein [Clostridia bacterium]
MKKKILALLTAVMLLAACGGSAQSAETAPEFVFTYAENQPVNYPTTKSAYRFSELVYKKTDGRIKINVYPNGELGDENSVVEQLQFGGIDFARVSVMTLSETVPQYNVLMLPYIYTDKAHMWRVLDGETGGEFMGLLDEYSLVGLSWFDAGARSFYNSKREIKSPDDLQGLSIRVADSALMAALIRSLGGTPVKLAYSEVYSALETGAVDGAENNQPSYISTRHDNVAKYFVTDEHCRIPEMQLCAQSTWEHISDEDRKILRDCAAEAGAYERELWTKQEESAIESMKKSGCIITELTAEQRAVFKEKTQPLYEEFAGDYMDLVQKVANA